MCERADIDDLNPYTYAQCNPLQLRVMQSLTITRVLLQLRVMQSLAITRDVIPYTCSQLNCLRRQSFTCTRNDIAVRAFTRLAHVLDIHLHTYVSVCIVSL